MGQRGLLDELVPDAVIAVLATVHPDTIRELASAAAVRGVTLVDSPLAGKGAGGLEDRSMWAFVGGDAATVDRLRAPSARSPAGCSTPGHSGAERP